MFHRGAATQDFRSIRPIGADSTSLTYPVLPFDPAVRLFVPPDGIRRIQILRYATGFETKASVEKTLRQLWDSRAEGPSDRITWAEGEHWSIDAQIEYRNGRKGRLVTDGAHTCIEDAAGRVWFFRRHTDH